MSSRPEMIVIQHPPSAISWVRERRLPLNQIGTYQTAGILFGWKRMEPGVPKGLSPVMETAFAEDVQERAPRFRIKRIVRGSRRGKDFS